MFESLAKKYNLIVLSGDNDGERRILEKMLPEKTQLVFNQKPEQKLAYIDHLQKEGKNVLMVDIVTDDFEKIKEKAKNLVILDHHKTNQAKLEGINYAYFDMHKSGVGLAWEYFYGNEEQKHELVSSMLGINAKVIKEVFNADRNKTNILMNIFNGEYSLLPDTIQMQLPKDRDQLYGKLVKIMMITQSGAEGISLKNVRRVLIMEYFWNAVRINQVIGRAVRTCSHQLLPKAEQNVGVFIYIMKLTKKQLDDNPTLRKKDNELTTDEHILALANNKENLINVFMDLLKSSSMDCIINAVQNKPIENGYKCYNWPINVNNNELTYTANIKDDKLIQKHQKYQVSRSNKGTVISKNGVKYVMIDKKLYDYFSYINTGVLLPAKIA